MSVHTPGPWRVEPYYGEDIEAEVCGKWSEVATLIDNAAMRDQRPIGTAFIRDANARLIAAAPDLLEALKKALHILDELDYRPDGEAAEDLAGVENALAKAEGR